MSGISTKAPGKLENRYKYNEIEFAGKEFNNGSGLEMYEAEYRNLDPQIGRWWQVDPRPTDHISPYASMDLNPIKNSDFYGDTSVPYHDLPNTPNFDPSKDVVILPEVEVKPTPAPTPLKKPEIDMNAKAGAAIGIPLPVSAPWTVPSVEIRPISIAAPNPIVLTIGLVLLPANYGGDGGSSYIKPGSHRYGGYHVPPKVLPGFPGAVREKPKAGRARWRLPNGKILEWDYQHGRVEQYDRTGRRHEGEYDPNTGEQTKPPDSGRSTQN